jgi:hypothetical protein
VRLAFGSGRAAWMAVASRPHAALVQVVSRLEISAARSSGSPRKPPSTGMLAMSVSLTKRSELSLESHTAAIRKPPSVGPAAW